MSWLLSTCIFSKDLQSSHQLSFQKILKIPYSSSSSCGDKDFSGRAPVSWKRHFCVEPSLERRWLMWWSKILCRGALSSVRYSGMVALCMEYFFAPCAVMAMALSFWKMVWKTKMWSSVAQKSPNTIAVAARERRMARVLEIHDGVALQYAVAAMAAPVIGNVYAHQDKKPESEDIPISCNEEKLRAE